MFNKKSELFKNSFKNAGWSTLDSIVSPLLMVISAPLLVRAFGVEQYGLWILVHSIVGLMGLVSIGLGDATTRYVAQYRATGRVSDVIHIVRVTALIYVVMGFVVSAIIYSSSPLLVSHIFKIHGSLQETAIHGIRLGGFMLAVKILDSVFMATLKGYERYDVSSRITIIFRVAVILVTVLLAVKGYGLVEILTSTLMIYGANLFVSIIIVKRFVPGAYFIASFDIDLFKVVYSYGFWSWVQGIAGTLFSQADRFLVTIILGTSALTYYSASLMVAQQVHAVLAAAAGFVFPLSSKYHSRGEIHKLREIYSRTMAIVTSLATVAVIIVYFFAPMILDLWMGADFVKEGTDVLRLLILAYGGLSLTIVPYYLLNGSGFIRSNVLFGALSGLIVISAGLVLLPQQGITGAGWAQLTNFFIIALYLIFIEKVIFKTKSWMLYINYIIPYVVPVGIAIMLFRLINPAQVISMLTIPIMLLVGLFGSAFSYYLSVTRKN